MFCPLHTSKLHNKILISDAQSGETIGGLGVETHSIRKSQNDGSMQSLRPYH
jgi:hypothetical protein